MKFAPETYRDTRKKMIESVEQGLRLTEDLTAITADAIKANPGILPALRMSACTGSAGAEPIVRNAQEKRQLALLEKYLTQRGYKLKAHPSATPLTQMEPGTFFFRLTVKPSKAESKIKIVKTSAAKKKPVPFWCGYFDAASLTWSNRLGLGRPIFCTPEGEHRQMDEVRSGGSYMSQSDLRVHFGLEGGQGVVDKLTGVPANRLVIATEGKSLRSTAIDFSAGGVRRCCRE